MRTKRTSLYKKVTWAVWIFSFLGQAAYLFHLSSAGQAVYDDRPWANLWLRLFLLDLLPILWVLPWFLPLRRGFLPRLCAQGMRRPLPLAPPVLAFFLFVHESAKAVLDPTTASPVTVQDTLWMEAAAALMVWLILSTGTSGERPQEMPSTHPSWFFALGVVVGGTAYFLKTHCDISRLLVLLGVSAWVLQKVLEKAHLHRRI